MWLLFSPMTNGRIIFDDLRYFLNFYQQHTKDERKEKFLCDFLKKIIIPHC